MATIQQLNPTEGSLISFGENPETATVYRFLGFGPNMEEGASAASSHPDVKLRLQSYWTGHVWNKKDSADTERFLSLECTDVLPTKIPIRIFVKPKLVNEDVAETLKRRIAQYEFSEVRELDDAARNKAHIVSRIKDHLDSMKQVFKFLDGLDAKKKAEEEAKAKEEQEASEQATDEKEGEDMVNEIAKSENPEMPL